MENKTLDELYEMLALNGRQLKANENEKCDLLIKRQDIELHMKWRREEITKRVNTPEAPNVNT